MAKSARRGSRKRRRSGLAIRLIGSLATVCGEVIGRNPAVAGGFTAFAVVFAYVASNALWYQPQAHGHVFLRTRPAHVFHATKRQPAMSIPQGSAASSSAKQSAAAPAPKSDPLIARMQTQLKELGLYDGPVDGIDGPQTESALEAYEKARPPVAKTAAAAPAGDQPASDPAGSQPAVVVPVPRPTPPEADVDSTTTTAEIPSQSASSRLPAADIVRIQAGLKAFGNDGIEIDGVIGSRTRGAIREFQALFHMPVTGEPDRALLAKMQDIGLIN